MLPEFTIAFSMWLTECLHQSSSTIDTTLIMQFVYVASNRVVVVVVGIDLVAVDIVVLLVHVVGMWWFR